MSDNGEVEASEADRARWLAWQHPLHSCQNPSRRTLSSNNVWQ